MRRGDLYLVRAPKGDVKRTRVVVVVSRQVLISSAYSTVVCAPVYTTRRGIATEVLVGTAEGLKHDSAVLCDELRSVPKSLLTHHVGELGSEALDRLAVALRVALDVEVV